MTETDPRAALRAQVEKDYDTAVRLFMSEIGRLCGFEFKAAPVSVFIALTKEYRNAIVTCAVDHLEEKQNG